MKTLESATSTAPKEQQITVHDQAPNVTTRFSPKALDRGADEAKCRLVFCIIGAVVDGFGATAFTAGGFR